MEVVRKWVEKTKKALMEEERKKEIIEKFREIFDIEPDKVEWTMDKTLEAVKRIKDLEGADLLILDRKVKEIIFIMYEAKDEMFDPHWRFEERKKHWYYIFRWSKRIGIYAAIVEIYVKIG